MLPHTGLLIASIESRNTHTQHMTKCNCFSVNLYFVIIEIDFKDIIVSRKITLLCPCDLFSFSVPPFKEIFCHVSCDTYLFMLIRICMCAYICSKLWGRVWFMVFPFLHLCLNLNALHLFPDINWPCCPHYISFAFVPNSKLSLDMCGTLLSFFPWASCAIHFVPCTNGINFTAWFEGPKTALLNSAGRRHDWCRAHAMTCNVFFAMSTDEAIQSIKLRTGLAELCPCAIEPFPYLKMKTSTGLNKCAE